ncbi:MAG: DUF2470 domain-containing protein [Actinobacteria bacterium]|nr:DUF2470 domain-containing protein [Actinomycetota bacterium]MBW3646155.1 DUF2470 domain-containing protein [Actinomycetota bacterium]
MAEVELAVLARTAVDCSRLGSLTTYDRHPSSQHTATIPLRARPDGSVELQVTCGSVSAGQLLARPIATLHVAPAGYEAVLLRGSARRLPRTSTQAGLVFHLEAAIIRVGARSALLDERAYRGAAPDPLRHDAPVVLSHLNDTHADALAACLRARGQDAAFARATRLDARGLTIVTVGSTGVATVRLDFPAAVASLNELPAGMACLLTPTTTPHPGGRSSRQVPPASAAAPHEPA